MMFFSATVSRSPAIASHANPAEVAPDRGRIAVEDRRDVEAVIDEHRRAGDRTAEPTGTDQRDVVLSGGAQDAPDLADQRVDVVPDAALAELAEARQITPDLRRVDVRVLGDVLRRDRRATHLLRLREYLQVAREARSDTNGEAIGHCL